MRFVRCVSAVAIAIAFIVTVFAPLRGASPVGDPAGGPVVLVDSYAIDPSAILSTGARLVADYGNGYYLMRVPQEATRFLHDLPGVDTLAGRTQIDLFFSGIQFDTAISEPVLGPGMDSPTVGTHLLQFLGPIRSEWVLDLERQGLTFEQYLSSYAFIVRGAPPAIDAAKHSAFVSWVGPYRAGYKVDARLFERAGLVDLYVVGFGDVDPSVLAQRVGATGASAEAFSYEPPTVMARAPAGLIGVLANLPEVLAIQERLPSVTLDRTAGQIHKYHAAWDTRRSGLTSTLTGRSPGPDLVLYNSDDFFEGAGIQDTGFDEGDPNDGTPDFFDSPNGDRITRFLRHTGPIPDGYCGSAHGSHVAGIIAGDGYSWERDLIEDSGDTSVSVTDKEWHKSEAGVAPEAKLSIDGTQAGNGPPLPCTQSGLNTQIAYWDCQYLNGYISLPVTAGVSMATCGNPWIDGANVATHNSQIDTGARAWFAVHSNSWGSGPGPYSIAWAGGADTRTNAAPERLIIFAAGNDGPDVNTVSSQALLKNGLSVAAGQNFRPEQFESDNPNLLAGFSSRGGAGQSSGRIKPDIVGIGTSVVSLFARGEYISAGFTPGADLINEVDKYCSVAKGYCAGGDGIPDYRYLQGTSMATPHIAGGALLIREYLREVLGGNNPSSPYYNPPAHLVKAVMINGAVRMDQNLYAYPGYDQGWGRMDLEQSLFPPAPRTNQVEINEMAGTGSWSPTTMNLNVVDDDVPLKVTLVWIDATGDALSRQLDLRVRSPSGSAEYHGDQYLNGWSNPNTASYDAINNVEQVEVERPEAGIWTVEVRGVSVPTPAKFALVFSANVGPQAAYKVDLKTDYPTTVSLAPGGSTTIPLTVLNYGTGPDNVTLSHTAPGVLLGSFQPAPVLPLASSQSQDVLAVITDAGATPGIYEFDLRAVSGDDPSPTPASDFLGVRVEVLASPLPYPLQVTNGTVDELDPSVLVFESPPGTRHIFIAYRKTSQVSADGRTGGVNVWIGHATLDANGIPGTFVHTRVSDLNDDPNDLRLLRFHAGTLQNRVVVTWTGNDPDEPNPDATSWARIAYADSPYSSWTLRTIQRNEGSGNACNIARVSFPLFRAAPGLGASGQLIYVWEVLAYGGGCAGNPVAVTTSAKTSLDGGITWSGRTQIFPAPGNPNFYFFPNGVVDQNDLAWVFVYWRTPTGNDRDLTVRILDDVGWRSSARNDYTILDTTDNVQWPAALSTTEGAAGSRVYVTFTRDNLQFDLKMYLTYTDKDYTSGGLPADFRDPGATSCGAGCTLSADFSAPTGSGLKGPYGTSVSNANYDRRPILNIVRTGDGIVWLPHMETANAYASPNLWTYYSSDGFVTVPPAYILTADAYSKGHQMSDTLSVGARHNVYEVYHSSRGTITQVNYEVYLIIYFLGWPAAPDVLGPVVTSPGGTPNPVAKENSFRVTANANDIATGNSRIGGLEYSIDSQAGPWNPMNALDAFDSPTEAALVDLDATALGWGDLECHVIYVRASDELGNVGPPAWYDQCTTGTPDPPPFSPVTNFANLGPTLGDVTISWNAATDQGLPGGTNRYRVYRQVGLSGSPILQTEIPADTSSTYAWTDVGAALDTDTNTYIYEIRSVDNADNEATAITRAAKFTRSVSPGWNLLSVPVITSSLSVTSVLQTLSWNRARTFVATDTADPWKAYISTKPYNDLQTIDHTQAVWVNALISDRFTVAGLVPSGVTITLQPGWNFVGFPSFRATAYTLTDLQAVVPQIIMVDAYDPGAPYYLHRMQDIETLQMGQGYWAYVDGSSPVTWAVP